MAPFEFLELVVDYAKQKYGKSTNDWLEMRIHLNGHKCPENDNAVKWAKKEFSEEALTEVSVSFPMNKFSRKEFFMSKQQFTKHAADAAFGRLHGNLDELKQFCNSRLLPLNQEWTGSVLEPKVDYVNFDGDGFSGVCQHIQLDKSFAVVVAGESGSGKSVFSCLEVKRREFLPVYILLRLKKPEIDEVDSTDLTSANEAKKNVSIDVADVYSKKPDSELKSLHELLRTVIISNRGNHAAVQALSALKKNINVSRNIWARELFEVAFGIFVKGNQNADAWKDRAWSQSMKPNKVAIILDEVTDIDLVEGLVEIVRELMADYGYLAKEQLLFVLVGTGLDAIRYPERVGTNPSLSRMVKVTGPDFHALNPVIEEPYSTAIDEGLYSRVLKSNTRMLFRCVIPTLKLEIFTCDGKYPPNVRRQRLKERLKEVASLRPNMDYAARFFVNQNTVGEMTGKQRDSVLAASFLYHLRLAIEEAEKNHGKNWSVDVRDIWQKESAAVKTLESEHSKVSPEEIFRWGLATKNGTSKALKYLACFGLSCGLRPGFGDEFEELTALHYSRLMEVQGYRVKRITLDHAWPPKSNKRDPNVKDIEELKVTLENLRKTELLRGLEVSPNEGKLCFIFSQGTATAQGGDILILIVNTSETTYTLESIQCKHFQKSPGGAKVRSWWSSLGIEIRGDHECDVQPLIGKAGYSFAGLCAFRDLLGQKIRKRVVLGNRTLAVSFQMPLSAEFPVPKSNCVRVWFREMLEPTISTFRLRGPFEEPVDVPVTKSGRKRAATTNDATTRKQAKASGPRNTKAKKALVKS